MNTCKCDGNNKKERKKIEEKKNGEKTTPQWVWAALGFGIGQKIAHRFLHQNLQTIYYARSTGDWPVIQSVDL